MSRNDDNDNQFQNERAGRGQNGNGASSANFAQTSDFSTALISEDGRFFGMKLSKDTASDLRKAYPMFLDYLRKKVEQQGVPLAESFAKSFLGHNPQQALHFGAKARNVLGYGTILSEQIFNVGRNVYDSAHSLNELRVAVHPLSRTEGGASTAPLSGNNEVVSNARGKIKNIFTQRLIQTGVSVIGTAPALFSKMHEQSAISAQQNTLRELESAKGDPKKLAEILEKKITVGGEALNVSGKELKEAKEILVDNHRKAYESKWKAFKSKNESSVRTEIENIVKEISPDNVRYQVRKLNNLGVNTDQISSELESAFKRRPEATEAAVKKAVDSFKSAATSKGKNHLLEEAVKTKFVRQEGAFDHEWLGYYGEQGRGRDRILTHKEELDKQIGQLEQVQHKAEEEKKLAAQGQGHGDYSSDMLKMASGLVSGIVGDAAMKMFGGKKLEEYAQPIALDRILHLRRVMEKAEGEAPAQVPGVAIGKTNDKDMGYARYVHQIFQQHQKDCHRTDIGERFTEAFEKARWDDTAIQKMSDDELNPYEYAVKTIAKRIKDGRMDAIAMIELAGNRRTKIVHDDGRSFGPLGSGTDEALVKEAIHKLIDEKTALLQGGKAQTGDQINDKLGDFVFSVEDLKQALESKDMDKQQRAFIFTLFSDVVGSDQALCAKIGVSEGRCKELRKESTDYFASMMDGAVQVLAEMIEHEPDALAKHLKLTEKEKKLILSLADRAENGHQSVMDVAENSQERKSLETVVANATMALANETVGQSEEGKPQNFWQRLVTAVRAPKEKQETHGRDEKMPVVDHAQLAKEFTGDRHPDSPDVDPRIAEFAHLGSKGKPHGKHTERHAHHHDGVADGHNRLEGAFASREAGKRHKETHVGTSLT